MIVDRDELRALRQGKIDEVLVRQRPPAIGAIVPLQVGVGKRASCHARVEDHWPITSGDHEGCHAVRLTEVVREVPTRFLGKSGYTTDPDLAKRDEEGSPEWAPPSDWGDPGVELRARERQDRADDRLSRRIEKVVGAKEFDRLLAMARERGVDIRSDLRVINKRLEAIAKKVEDGREAA
ncbi:MAG TPA: hypothetical protein VEW67_04115 [Thermoleophilaceae bacterium]|nr:hypothetical protein [Thermoleophilaceae bacterium]